MAAVIVRVLGPLSVRRDGELVRLPAGRIRVVLTALALHHGELVSRDRLIDAAWGERAPATAPTQLQGLISALRRVLPPGAIETHGPAYLLRLGAVELDLATFQAAVAAARQAARTAQGEEAVASYRVALEAWSGPVFDGLDSGYLAGHAARLRELHSVVVEDWARQLLIVNRPAAAIEELSAQVAADPVRESSVAVLMTALYRAGRQADALAVFRTTRAALRETLGVEPGPDLQDLHQRMLAADPALTADAAPVDPAGADADSTPLAQLPPDAADFTGRDMHIKHLVDTLAPGTGSASVVALVTGIGGVGKTTLAVHVAHRLRTSFPDGQIYVNLRGSSARPVSAAEVAGRALRDLGMRDASIPSDEDERIARYRSALADRRLLLVLDDARETAHVQPLLPAGGGSAVLVTSRHRMPGLAATRVDLAVMDRTEAESLFVRIVGEDRASAEPNAVAAVLSACGHLPLAIRLAASRLAVRPSWRVHVLAERLATPGHRLDELATEDRQARATFQVSYRMLSKDQARAFGLLAVPDLDDISVAAAAAVLDLDQRGSERLTEALVDVNLLDTTVPGRYRYHDLLRLYAREQGDSGEADADRRAALSRLAAWYHDRALAAAHVARLAFPRSGKVDEPFHDADQARRWLDREYRNITLTLIQCARVPGVDLDELAQTLEYIEQWLRGQGHWTEWEHAAAAVLSAALESGVPTAELIARSSLGHLAIFQGDRDKARRQLNRALALAHITGDRVAESRTLNRLGTLALNENRFRDALVHNEQALAVSTDLGDQRGQFLSLINGAGAHRYLHECQQALHLLDRALVLADTLVDPESRSMVMHQIACCQAELGNVDQAIAAHQECLALTRNLGHREGEAYTLAQLGRAHLAAHQPAAAALHLRAAIDIFHMLGATDAAADFSIALGRAHQETGQAEAAWEAWTRALGYYAPRDSATAETIRDLLHAVRLARQCAHADSASLFESRPTCDPGVEAKS
jgi:DNA-binding SARP family transcriptional activator/tetratricopeptide (TPR) repeat protein